MRSEEPGQASREYSSHAQRVAVEFGVRTVWVRSTNIDPVVKLQASSLARLSTDRKLPGICIQLIRNGFSGLSSDESENRDDTLDYREKAKDNGARTVQFTT